MEAQAFFKRSKVGSVWLVSKLSDIRILDGRTSWFDQGGLDQALVLDLGLEREVVAQVLEGVVEVVLVLDQDLDLGVAFEGE